LTGDDSPVKQHSGGFIPHNSLPSFSVKAEGGAKVEVAVKAERATKKEYVQARRAAEEEMRRVAEEQRRRAEQQGSGQRGGGRGEGGGGGDEGTALEQFTRNLHLLAIDDSAKRWKLYNGGGGSAGGGGGGGGSAAGGGGSAAGGGGSAGVYRDEQDAMLWDGDGYADSDPSHASRTTAPCNLVHSRTKWSGKVGGVRRYVLYSHCTNLCSYCTHTVLILYSYCTHTVLILFSYCTHTVLILYSYCSHTILILYSYCTFIPVTAKLYASSHYTRRLNIGGNPLPVRKAACAAAAADEQGG
jgi:hypothetical protein